MYTSGALHYTVYIHHPQLTAISNFVNIMFIHSPEAAGSNHLAAASQTYKIGIALYVVVTAVYITAKKRRVVLTQVVYLSFIPLLHH